MNKAYLQSKLPPIEMVTDLSPSNITYRQMQTLHNGRADVWADLVSYGHGVMDTTYSYPIGYHPYLFIYAKRLSLDGDPFTGVFDLPSYISIGVSFIALSVSIWLALVHEKANTSLLHVLFKNFGNVFGQGIDILPKRTLTSSILFLFIGSFTFLRLMYASIIMAKLTAKVDGLTINSAEDLNKYKDLRILYIVPIIPETEEEKKKSVNSALKPFIDRIDWLKLPRFSPEELKYFIGNISLKMSKDHVLVETKAGFGFFRKFVDKKVLCSMPMASFKMSKEHLSNRPSGWVFRRGFHWIQFFNEELMWEAAYFGHPDKFKQK